MMHLQPSLGSSPTNVAPQTGDGSEPAHRLADRRVLVAEDEALIAMEIEAVLLDAGTEVVGPAGYLEYALELAEEDAVDVALLDVDLGGEDVFPLADRLAERGVPFAFHTGHAERADLARCYPEAPVCRKPTPMDELLKRLAGLLDA